MAMIDYHVNTFKLLTNYSLNSFFIGEEIWQKCLT